MSGEDELPEMPELWDQSFENLERAKQVLVLQDIGIDVDRYDELSDDVKDQVDDLADQYLELQGEFYRRDELDREMLDERNSVEQDIITLMENNSDEEGLLRRTFIDNGGKIGLLGLLGLGGLAGLYENDSEPPDQTGDGDSGNGGGGQGHLYELRTGERIDLGKIDTDNDSAYTWGELDKMAVTPVIDDMCEVGDGIIEAEIASGYAEMVLGEDTVEDLGPQPGEGYGFLGVEITEDAVDQDDLTEYAVFVSGEDQTYRADTREVAEIFNEWAKQGLEDPTIVEYEGRGC